MQRPNVVTRTRLVSLLLPAIVLLTGFHLFGPTLAVAASNFPLPRAQQVRNDSLESRFAHLEARLPALEALLAQCRTRGISTAYEMVDYTTIKQFIPWGREDQSTAIATTLEQLYQEATINLQAYLHGTKQPLVAPEYVTQRPKITGYSFLGDMRWPAGRIEHQRPIYYVGYGFDYNVVQSIPAFAGYGNNIVQIDQIGPSNVVYKEGTLDWPTSRTDSAAKIPFVVDTAVAHSGTRSLRISNVSDSAKPVGDASLTLYLEPHSTYRLTAWVKGHNVHNASLRTFLRIGRDSSAETVHPITGGTYEWQQAAFSVTTGDEFLVGLGIQTAGPTDQLWLDDLRMVKEGSDENLIPDPGFEAIPAHTASGYYGSQTDLKAELLGLLKLAAKSNVAVNLLLNGSPGGSAAMINRKDEAYKLTFELYLKTLIPLIKDHPALHSICLTNEPNYWSDGDETDRPAWQAYLQHVYGDIAHLNAVYGAHYATFADVPVGADKHHPPARETREAAHLYDWLAFNDVQFATYHRWMADFIHQLAPNLPIHSKIQVRNPGDGIDPAWFAEFSDISGSDSEDLWWYDLQGSLRVAPIFNSEDHVLQGVDDPRRTRVMLWQGAIHGRNASTIWLWERHAEDDLLQRPEFVATIGKTAVDLNRLAPEVTALHAAPTRVAILHAHTALSVEAGQAEEQNAALDVGMHGQRAALVTDEQIAAGKLRQYKLVLIPASELVARTTLTALVRFVDSGGRIITIGDAAGDSVLMWDNHGQRLPSEVRAHVLANAVEGFTTKNNEPERAPLAQQLDALTRVHVLDAATHQPFVYKTRGDWNTGVQWTSVNYRGRWLVNVVVNGPTEQAVSLVVNGRKVERVKDLISGESFVGPSFHLQGLTPYLFEVLP